jgi:hypothetical protein
MFVVFCIDSFGMFVITSQAISGGRILRLLKILGQIVGGHDAKICGLKCNGCLYYTKGWGYWSPNRDMI